MGALCLVLPPDDPESLLVYPKERCHTKQNKCLSLLQQPLESSKSFAAQGGGKSCWGGKGADAELRVVGLLAFVYLCWQRRVEGKGRCPHNHSLLVTCTGGSARLFWINASRILAQDPKNLSYSLVSAWTVARGRKIKR